MGCYRICGVDVTTPAGACLSLLLFLICFQIFLEFVDDDDVHHHHYYPCKGCTNQQPGVAADGVGRGDAETPHHQHSVAWTEGTSPGSIADDEAVGHVGDGEGFCADASLTITSATEPDGHSLAAAAKADRVDDDAHGDSYDAAGEVDEDEDDDDDDEEEEEDDPEGELISYLLNKKREKEEKKRREKEAKKGKKGAGGTSLSLIKPADKKKAAKLEKEKEKERKKKMKQLKLKELAEERLRLEEERARLEEERRRFDEQRTRWRQGEEELRRQLESAQTATAEVL